MSEREQLDEIHTFPEPIAHFIVGKRVRDFYVYSRPQTPACRIILLTTDLQATVISSRDSMHIQYIQPMNEEFLRVFKEPDYEDTDSAVYDRDRLQEKELHALFHTLWSKAPPGATYDKKEWKRLAEILCEAGLDV